MVFSSTVFLFLFLPILLLIYFGVRKELRNGCLLLSSLFFYAWGEGLFIALMLASITINYVLGLLLVRYRGGHRAKLIVILGCALNLSFLGWYKYANFLVDNINRVLGTLGLALIELEPIHLPIGISFFTFQAMSYIIDVYRNDVKVQKNPLNLALYISLFPQLIAGPIVRFKDVSEQIAQRTISSALFVSGVQRFTIGLGKKVLIANAVALPADQIFAIPTHELTFGLAWFGAICYALQIYFDFSGYSDMAIGLGRMFGFRFLENFNYPYVSKSMGEFWRRWHISLSSWFRDYLYIPLGGNRGGVFATYRNLIIVFTVTGFWHGASWNFVIWGLYHGTFLILERLGNEHFNISPPRILKHGYVLIVALVGWVFFRAETLPYALEMLGVMLGLGDAEEGYYYLGVYMHSHLLLMIAFGCIGSMPWLPKLEGIGTGWSARQVGLKGIVFDYSLTFARMTGLVFILLASALVLSAQTHNPFIYFRF